MLINFPNKKSPPVLALGGESAGNFSVLENGKIYFSEDFGDLLEEKNWALFQKAVLKYLKDNRITPKIVLSDLHPLFRTTLWGEKLAKKHKAKHLPVQHHLAHIFSAIGDKMMQDTSYLLPTTFYGIALDGTGYGMDEKIWGGEIFKVESIKYKVKSIIRIGHLENQTLIGGEAAIREPARMLLTILNKFLSKDEVYKQVKKYYSQNEFELLYNQLQQNFNCLETSSAGRFLDAVSLLLGFCGNERKYKHEPISLLEANSAKPYFGIRSKIDTLESDSISNNQFSKKYQILSTTYLFEYLIKNLGKDKHRLAATAQLYVAEGLYEILRNTHNTSYILHNTFLTGGIANTKIISEFLLSKGVYANKKIPRGDAGLSFGQIIYSLLS